MSKTIVIYAGRFQPFHVGHLATYRYLQNSFPTADIWIASSGTVSETSPFTFVERKALAELAGIPTNRIMQVKNPYIASEILAEYDSTTDHVIFAISQKDADRIKFGIKKNGLPTYLQPYIPNTNLMTFDTTSGHAYVVNVPVITFQIANYNISSASDIRTMLSKQDSILTTRVLIDLYGSNADASAEIILSHSCFAI